MKNYIYGVVQRYKNPIDRYIDTILNPSFDVAGVDTEEIVEESEVESSEVKKYTDTSYTRILFLLVSLLAILSTVWHILYFIHPVIQGVPFRATHLLLMGTILFLTTFSTSETRWKRYLWNASTVLLLAGLAIGNIYLFMEFDTIWMRAGRPSQMDFYMSLILVIVTIEGTRRAYGNVFFFLAAGVLLYGAYGNYLPGIVGHGGLSWNRLLTAVVFPDLTGLYGFLLGLSATLITIYIYLGIFLQRLGGAEFFADAAMRFAGGIKSGPAQVAVVSSGFMATLTGAAVANVAATGAFTIPLMKRMGYDPEFSGAIESVASTGGQITPPVMGAAAFIMASIIGRPYVEIIIAAAIPAVLYYITVMITAHIRATKLDLEPFTEPPAELGSLLLRSYLLIPILVVVYELLQGTTASVAAWRGTVSLFVLYILFTMYGNRHMTILDNVKDIVRTMVISFDDASRTLAPLVMLLALLGWIIQVFNATGLLGKLAAGLIYLAGGEMFMLLLLTAAICILFGFGIPTTAAYIIVALIAAPSLTQMGIDPMAAHLFVFYYAVLSAISPPVAAACLVATGISKGDFIRTCKTAMQIALPAYILPFIWIYNPAILGEGSFTAIAVIIGSVIGGIVMVVTFFEGYLLTDFNLVERGAAGVAAALLFFPDHTLSLVALGIVAAIVLYQLRKIEFGKFAADIA